MDAPALRMGAAAAAVAAAAALAAAVPEAEAAVLWDLVVTVEVVNAPLAEGQGPDVRGTVVDHAGDPVAGAAVQVRTGHGSASVEAGANGTFAHSFGPQPLLPGEHSVHAMATSPPNLMGAASASYRVDGDLTLSSRTAQLLATPEAQRYLAADPAGFAGDPIGMRLYGYYQGLRAQHADQEAAQREIDGRAAELDEARSDADNRTRAALEERHVHDGTLSGSRMDWFLGSLDPSIRTVVAQQINFTTGVFENAREAMRDVLARGGSIEEARAAYLEAATVPKSVIEDLELAEKYGAWSIVGGLNLSAARAAGDANSTDVPPGGGDPPSATAANSTSTAPAAPAPSANTTTHATAPAPAPATNMTTPAPASPAPAPAQAANSTAPAPAPAQAANSTAPAPAPAQAAKIEVVQSGTTIILNINGTAAEFVVNGTSIVQRDP